MSGDPFNSYQQISEISAKKQNMDKLLVNFFLHEKNWEKKLFFPR